jgi:hypothetical protein
MTKAPVSSGDAQAHQAPAMDVAPYNASHLDEAREQWAAANWKALSQINREALEIHPDRSRLAMISAASALQTGDRRAAHEQIQRAVQWGCDKRFMLSVLVASARHSLGRACLAADRTEQAAQHLQRSLFDQHLQSEGKRVAREHTDKALAELATRRELVGRQRESGLRPQHQPPPVWVNELVTRCLSMDDVHEAVDSVLDSLLSQADERVWFLMCLAEQFELKGDKHTAVSYLNTAMEFAHGAHAELRLVLARRLVASGQAATAMDMLVSETIDAVRKQAGADDGTFAQSLAHTYRAVREAEQSRREHGHELLLAHLKRSVTRLKAQAGGRRLNMVEIGTTRENVPGQGSTRKLAEFCRQEGIAFVTVDMDPHNTQVAQRMFERLSMGFQAVAMKGEDYLRARQEQVDFAFLDAYDFDHGKHSELRQSRYVKYLGTRIDEEACHRMHLDCAESLLRLLSPHGVICLDDTWLDNGHWTAKGTLAVPFLLEHGFEIIDARNRAALLRRLAGSPATA